MIIALNGKQYECEEGKKLLDLIRELGIESKVMAAAVNMEIVKKEKWSECILHDGDRVELLNFVGGG